MKKTITVLLVILLLSISGCTFSSIKSKMPGTAPSGKEDFVGGSKGLESEIINPIENGKAYLNVPFQIVIRLNNVGESAAKGATCAFGSFSSCECKTFELEGKRRVEKEKLEGEEETLTFEGGQVVKEELGGASHFVTAKTRYDYKTYGIIKACVKKDVYSEEGACQITPGRNIIKSVSSAPISIVEVTEEMIPEENKETAKLVFGIKIKNIGRGNLYSLDGDKTQCETTAEEIRNRINVNMINAPGKAICNQAELKKEGEATTHCTVENVKISGESYEPEITIELEYAYETIDSNKFEVV